MMTHRTLLSSVRKVAGMSHAARRVDRATTLGADLDSAEAQCLRQEITTRITLMNAVIALEAAALGAGLSFISKPSYILAALAASSSFLWLLWMDQSIYTYKIAAYLAVELAPRLSQLAQRPVLGWERFLRCLEANSEISRRALYPDPDIDGRPLRFSGRHAEWYVPLLFAVTSPLLLFLYVVDTRDSLTRVLPACMAAGTLWAYTVIRFTLLSLDIKVINDAILAATPRQSVTGRLEHATRGEKGRQTPTASHRRQHRAARNDPGR